MQVANDYTRNPKKCAETNRAYFTEKEVAERLNMSVKWLQKMRGAGGGIKYSKFGGAVRYPIEEIERFERESRRNHTSEYFEPTASYEPENGNGICSMQLHADHMANETILPINHHSRNQ